MKDRSLDIRKLFFKDILIYFIVCIVISVCSIGTITFYSYYLAKKHINNTASIAVKKLYGQKQKELNQILDLHAVWDQCYQNVVQQFNEEWLKSNIGYDVAESFGMDLILILDNNANVVYGFEKGKIINGHLLNSEDYKTFLLAYEMQRKPPLQRASVVTHAGKNYFASICQIVPSNRMLAQTSAATRYLLFAREIDDDFLKKFELQDLLTLSVTKTLSNEDIKENLNLPLKNEERIVSYLIWAPKTSAMDILKTMIPIMVIVLILLCLLCLIIIRRILTAANEYQNLIGELFSTTQNLIAAKNEIEKTSTEKSMFLANISHEIRTPMNGIVGMISLMRETILDQKQSNYLSVMQKSSDALMIMIDNILEFSNLQLKGDNALQLSTVDLKTLLTNIEELLSPVAFQKGIEFNIHFAPGFPEKIYSDELRLRQAILQLTTNAIKFTKTGSVQIHLAHNLRKEEDDEILVQVIDTGIGISDSIKNQMFKEFFQGDQSITRAFDGSGLGLTLARSAVHTLGGKIGVESKLGKGSTFWFSFPLRTEGKGSLKSPIKKGESK